MVSQFCLIAAFMLAFNTLAHAQDSDEAKPPRIQTPLFEQSSGIHLPSTPESFKANGLLEEWVGIIPRSTSSGTSNQRAHTAWIAEAADGLVVAWPGSLSTGEHLHLDLASLAVLDLPEIGWLRRFGSAVSYSDAQACAREHPDGSTYYSVAECEQWYAAQVVYRRQLVDRFIRHMDINRVGVVRTHTETDPTMPLRPSKLPVAKAGKDGIEIIVPWNSLPTTDALLLDRVYLRLALCSDKEHGSEATECREMMLHGKPADNDPPRPIVTKAGVEPYFTPLVLATSRHYAVTECDLPLLGDRAAGWGSSERGYFLPGISPVVNKVMAFHQPAMSYQDAPDGMSPTPILSDYASTALGQDEWLCYPPLTWKKGKTLVTDSGNWYVGDDKGAGDYATLPVDATNLLVISGPLEHSSRSGMGQCGACPRKALSIWYLDRDAETLTQALAIDEIVEGFEDGASISMAISDNGRKVDYVYDRCTYSLNEEPGGATEPETYTRRCTRLKIDWCLEAGAREYTECHRSEAPMSPSLLD